MSRVTSIVAVSASALILSSCAMDLLRRGYADRPLEMRSERKVRASASGRRHAVRRPSIAVANDDAYSVDQDTALTVSAPGVLANDAPNGGVITAYGPTTGLEQGTIGAEAATAMGGSVRVEADGSFVYVPADGFSGADTFAYVLQNAGGGDAATVTITVAPVVQQTTFTVTSPGFFYVFTGLEGQNPKLTLKRGTVYTFNINTDSIHPFEILGAPPGSLSNNNISQGTIVFQVPLDAQNYAYECSIHHFGNDIETIP